MPNFRFTVDEKLSGKRLDIAILEAEIGLSRRKAKAMIDIGGAYVNRKRIRKASYLVKFGDKVDLQYNPQALKALKQDFEGLGDEAILYRDHDVIAVNKPPGLPSQATRDQDVRHLVPCLRTLLESRGERPPQLILCHRLDKETSGVVLVATSAIAATFLTDAFRERTVKKVYHALVRGLPQDKSFTINCYLSAIDKRTGSVRVVKAGGKQSETKFELIKAFPQHGVSLLRCEPLTGRSHQIRVHCESVGFPIVGDKRYGTALPVQVSSELLTMASTHHLLHAASLKFRPSKASGEVLVEASYPPSWEAVLEFLGWS